VVYVTRSIENRALTSARALMQRVMGFKPRTPRGRIYPSCVAPLLDLKLELVDLAEQRFEQRRSVGPAVAEN
jgi:hypothetical protein